MSFDHMNLVVVIIAFAIAFFILWRRAFVTDRRSVIMIGNREENTGRRAETMEIRNGDLICPDCGFAEMLGGPSGGVAQNCACNHCLSEFNIIGGNPPIILDRMGKLSIARAQVYGISPEEWKERQGENPTNAVS